MQACTFDHNTFSTIFEEDLATAKRSVIIQSPFISSRGIARLTPALLDLKKRQIQVCVFVKEPKGQHNPTEVLSPAEKILLGDFENDVKTLKSLGAHVNVRARIHEKVVIIDFGTLYDGSMNVLSYNPTFTSERMTRLVNAYKALSTIVSLSLDSCSGCINRPPEISPENFVLTADSLGKIICTLRKEREITQVSFASKCKTSRQNINRIESGNVIPPLKLLLDMAAALDHKIVFVPDFAVPYVAEIVRLIPSPFSKLAESPQTSVQTEFAPPPRRTREVSQPTNPKAPPQGIPGSLIHD